MPVSELRKWSFDNGTPAVFITDQPDLPFIKSMPGATVEPCSPGEKVHIIVSSDSWFVAFCIAHARHITAVAPETLRTMIVARAQRELSLGTREEDTPDHRLPSGMPHSRSVRRITRASPRVSQPRCRSTWTISSRTR